MFTREDAKAVVIDAFSLQNVTVNRIDVFGIYMDPDGVIIYSLDYDTDMGDGWADVYELDNEIFIEVHE